MHFMCILKDAANFLNKIYKIIRIPIRILIITIFIPFSYTASCIVPVSEGINQYPVEMSDIYKGVIPKGMTRVVLTTNNGSQVNRLTQDMMPLSLGKRTIYYVQDVLDLYGDTIKLPDDCFLKFEGGKLINGTLDIGKSTIIAPSTAFIFDNVSIIHYSGKAFDCYVNWWGVNENNSFNNDYLEKALNNQHDAILRVAPGSYMFNETPVRVKMNSCVIVGDGVMGRGYPFFNVKMTSNATKNHNYFLNIDAIRVSISNISFNGSSLISNTGAVKFNDGIFAGQVDCVVSNCFFHNFADAVCVVGRGITINECVITGCGNGLFYKVPSEQFDDDHVWEVPPFDGRAVIFESNRCHGLTPNSKVGYMGTMVFADYNGESKITQKGTLIGMRICNNTSDHYGKVLFSKIPIRNSLISNNVVLLFSGSVISLMRGANKVTISTNIFTHVSEYEKNIVPHIIEISTMNMEGYPIKDIIICNNQLSGCQKEPIHFNYNGKMVDSKMKEIISNISITGNIIDSYSLSELSISNCSVENLIKSNNIMSGKTGRECQSNSREVSD